MAENSETIRFNFRLIKTYFIYFVMRFIEFRSILCRSIRCFLMIVSVKCIGHMNLAYKFFFALKSFHRHFKIFAQFLTVSWWARERTILQTGEIVQFY